MEDLTVLQNKHNIHHVMFNDEMLPPARLRSISETIIRHDFNISWLALARLDKNFNRTTFCLGYSAGLRFLTFGLEAGSQTLLNKMNKGIDSNEAGIWNNVFLLLGFPGETCEEFTETIEFMKKNGHVIDSLYGRCFPSRRWK